ncbi:MAG TPA: hypothetical protein VNC50_03175, partial [Planctomycetia bacterium]|nr:hypothetical protein [Planctomycetia bacterium]
MSFNDVDEGGICLEGSGRSECIRFYVVRNPEPGVPIWSVGVEASLNRFSGATADEFWTEEWRQLMAAPPSGDPYEDPLPREIVLEGIEGRFKG